MDTERSPAEAAVRSMKLLMTGYQIWGRRSRTAIDDLAATLRMPPAALRAVIAALQAEGLVVIDSPGDLVALTPAGVRALDLEAPSAMN